MSNRKTFEQWMAEVNAECSRRVGLTADDLSDINYAELHERGTSPKVAASKAIRSSGGD
jgi:hypothetical protein